MEPISLVDVLNQVRSDLLEAHSVAAETDDKTAFVLEEGQIEMSIRATASEDGKLSIKVGAFGIGLEGAENVKDFSENSQKLTLKFSIHSSVGNFSG